MFKSFIAFLFPFRLAFLNTTSLSVLIAPSNGPLRPLLDLATPFGPFNYCTRWCLASFVRARRSRKLGPGKGTKASWDCAHTHTEHIYLAAYTGILLLKDKRCGEVLASTIFFNIQTLMTAWRFIKLENPWKDSELDVHRVFFCVFRKLCFGRA